MTVILSLKTPTILDLIRKSCLQEEKLGAAKVLHDVMKYGTVFSILLHTLAFFKLQVGDFIYFCQIKEASTRG